LAVYFPCQSIPLYNQKILGNPHPGVTKVVDEKEVEASYQWLMPVILITQETEVRRIMFES
jgi:hypothetical protein